MKMGPQYTMELAVDNVIGAGSSTSVTATKKTDEGDNWGITYPSNWPVWTPYEEEDALEKQ